MAETKFGTDILGEENVNADAAADEAAERAASIDWATETVNFGALERHLAGQNGEPLIIGNTPIAVEQPRKRTPKYGRVEPRREEPSFADSDASTFAPLTEAAESTYGRTAESSLHDGSDLAEGPIVHLPESADLSDACEEIADAIELDAHSIIIDEEPATEGSDILAMADEACEAETQILAAGAMPPERVKFTAPLEMMVEGHGDLHRGAVLNLSSTGLACAMPIELTPGQRVWVRFKLGLAEEPLSLLCAVIWRRDANPQHVLYGLQFTSLADDEATRIGTTVRERLDGRAADWPLPLMPTGEIPRPTPRKYTSTWTSVAFGMIGGMALALALSALPHIMSAEADDDELPAAAVAQIEPLPASPTPVVIGAQASGEPVIEMPSPDAIAGAMQQVEHSAVANALAQTAKPAVVAKADEAKLAKDPPNGGLLPRKTTGNTAEVTIAGGASTKAHSFWLDNPRRYVVDVPGKHAAAKAPDSTTIVSRVRTGSYEDKTRYVMEVASSVHDARVEPRGNALIVTLSK